jgi:soluble lytic murein transglycosylase-like protein
MFLNTFFIWRFVVFVIISGYVLPTSPLSEPEQSVQVVPKSSQALVPEADPDTEPSDKKPRPTSSALSVKEEQSFLPIIQRVSLRYDIDPALVRAIIMVESKYNPNAISVKGAKGLMQLMPVTAKNLGVKDVFNPEQNIYGGVRHFKFLLNQFDGNVKLALAAYNAGSRPVKRYKDIPPYKETKQYIKKVFRYYEFYKERG